MDLISFQTTYDEAYKRFDELKTQITSAEAPSADEYKALDEATDAVEAAERSLDDARQRAARHAELEKRRSERSDRIGVPAVMTSEKPEYSIIKALRGALAMREGKGRFDGYEAEVHQELLSKRDANSTSLGGVLIPFEVPMKTRAINTTTGVGLVATNTYPTMIEALQARLVTRQLGVTVLTGLVGNVPIPRKSGRAQYQWLAEGQNPSDSPYSTDVVTLSPKTCAATYTITRKMVHQTSYDVEEMAENDLVSAVTYALDEALLIGPGTGNAPRGVTNTSGVGQVVVGANGGPLTWALIYKMIGLVNAANAANDSRGFALAPQLLSFLAATAKANNTASYIYDDNGVAGFKALDTSILPANTSKGTGTNLATAIYGNWSDAILGLWNGGIEVLVDPYSAGPANIKVSAIVDADVQLRHPEAFVVTSDAATS